MLKLIWILIQLAAPIVGIVGFFSDISWMYYVGCGISLFLTVTSILSGQLNPKGILWDIIAIVVIWIMTKSFITGLLLGPTFTLLISMAFVLILAIFGVGANVFGKKE